MWKGEEANAKIIWHLRAIALKFWYLYRRKWKLIRLTMQRAKFFSIKTVDEQAVLSGNWRLK